MSDQHIFDNIFQVKSVETKLVGESNQVYHLSRVTEVSPIPALSEGNLVLGDKMRPLVLVLMGLLLMSSSLKAQESLQKRLDELDRIGSDWIYGDFDHAKRQAKEINQPIFALFR